MQPGHGGLPSAAAGVVISTPALPCCPRPPAQPPQPAACTPQPPARPPQPAARTPISTRRQAAWRPTTSCIPDRTAAPASPPTGACRVSGERPGFPGSPRPSSPCRGPPAGQNTRVTQFQPGRFHYRQRLPGRVQRPVETQAGRGHQQRVRAVRRDADLGTEFPEDQGASRRSSACCASAGGRLAALSSSPIAPLLAPPPPCDPSLRTAARDGQDPRDTP